MGQGSGDIFVVTRDVRTHWLGQRNVIPFSYQRTSFWVIGSGGGVRGLARSELMTSAASCSVCRFFKMNMRRKKWTQWALEDFFAFFFFFQF